MRDRRKAYRFGLDAERLAALALALKGYRIVARRWRGGGGEIDLVARRGRVVAIVEVKARPDLRLAAQQLTPGKIAQLRRAVASLRAERSLDDRHTVRLDLVLVAPWRWPRHIPDVAPLDA